MTRTLICNVPPMDFTKPPLAGAILCAICEKLGHTVTAIDLQVELNKHLKINNLSIDFLDDVFYNFTHNFTDQQEYNLDEFINLQVEQIIKQNYDYILIGLFSYLGQKFTTKFLAELRNKTTTKIIIGGPGVTSSSYVESNNNYGQNLKDLNLIDCYITGEAEDALPMYFSLGEGPGINNRNFKQLNELDQYSFPNYSYYNFTDYSPDLELAVIGSRGCVRSCTFCDVIKTSPKYRYRSGNNIADEIIQHYEKHGITKFYFTDSLVNGSEKSFNDMCNALGNYKFDKPISWSGQYIFRSQKSTSKEHFDLLKISGCSTLFAGIETGSDRIRYEIGKKFTNDDIEFYLENFSKIDVKVLFLFFSGYISETQEDHSETLRMFKRWQKYVATETITAIETLNILSILPGSPLENIARNSNFHFMQNDDGSINNLFWINPTNPTLDFNERVRRHTEMMKEAIKYKWPIWNGDLSLDLFYKALLQYNTMAKNKTIRLIPIG
jgi:radical SAM superfamily enzyme YgiQ (UPF0313 family)